MCAERASAQHEARGSAVCVCVRNEHERNQLLTKNLLLNQEINVQKFQFIDAFNFIKNVRMRNQYSREFQSRKSYDISYI